MLRYSRTRSGLLLALVFSLSMLSNAQYVPYPQQMYPGQYPQQMPSQYGPQTGSQYGPQLGFQSGSQYGSQPGSQFGAQFGSQSGSQFGAQFGSQTDPSKTCGTCENVIFKLPCGLSGSQDDCEKLDCCYDANVIYPKCYRKRQAACPNKNKQCIIPPGGRRNGCSIGSIGFVVTKELCPKECCFDTTQYPYCYYKPSLAPTIASHAAPTRYFIPEFSQWGRWSACSTLCGKGETSRNRTCLSSEEQCKASYLPLTQTIKCDVSGCKKWAQELPARPCSVTCGVGVQLYQRRCTSGTMYYQSCLYREAKCIKDACPMSDLTAPAFTTPPPPENGWGSWDHWSSCSEECSPGTHTRTRPCYYGGRAVPIQYCNYRYRYQPTQTVESESAACNSELCTIWALWGHPSGCSATCGPTSVRTYQRKCRNLYHAREPNTPGYKKCSTKKESCNADPCPTPYQAPTEPPVEAPPLTANWGEWKPWSTNCSDVCAVGVYRRTRDCVFSNGSIAENYLWCHRKEYEETKPCNEGLCEKYTPWKYHGRCSVSCITEDNTGIDHMKRKCRTNGTIPFDECVMKEVECTGVPSCTSLDSNETTVSLPHDDENKNEEIVYSTLTTQPPPSISSTYSSQASTSGAIVRSTTLPIVESSFVPSVEYTPFSTVPWLTPNFNQIAEPTTTTPPIFPTIKTTEPLTTTTNFVPPQTMGVESDIALNVLFLLDSTMYIDSCQMDVEVPGTDTTQTQTPVYHRMKNFVKEFTSNLGDFGGRQINFAVQLVSGICVPSDDASLHIQVPWTTDRNNFMAQLSEVPLLCGEYWLDWALDCSLNKTLSSDIGYSDSAATIIVALLGNVPSVEQPSAEVMDPMKPIMEGRTVKLLSVAADNLDLLDEYPRNNYNTFLSKTACGSSYPENCPLYLGSIWEMTGAEALAKLQPSK